MTIKSETVWQSLPLEAKIKRARLLQGIERLSYSAFLRQLMDKEMEAFQQAMQDIDGTILALLAPDPAWSGFTSAELAKVFRRRKRLLILLLAALDYGDFVEPPPDLMTLTGWLSDFAALALEAGVSSLMKEAGFSDHRGVCIFGMGKLGGGELNYSSDIDVIVLFDAEHLVLQVGDGAYRKIQRVARQLVTFMEAPDSEGYIFRTDLRLRPDPASTPLAVEVEAAANYYESMGLAWERAAMLKARVVAGDRALAEGFLSRIRPFVWRKSLDYASVEDIRAIRDRAIQSHHQQGFDGANVKLLEGGIREIELFAQIFQLIWGGRKPELRVIPTLKALEILAAEGIIPVASQQVLTLAYRYYRRLEHAAQLLDDHQRHHLPASDDEWQSFAQLFNSTREEILATFLGHVKAVCAICVTGREETRSSSASANSPDMNLFDPRRLRQMGYRDPDAVLSLTERWLGGSYRVSSSERARKLLESILPRLLKAFAATVSPDDALSRMDKFLEVLPAGVQMFSLFSASPELLRYCADIMGNAPRLALWLQRKPSLFEYLLHNENAPLPTLPVTLRGLEETLDDCRRLVQEVEFRVSVGFMAGKVTSAEIYQHFSQTAEVVIGQTLRSLRAENAKLAQRNFAIIALGKLGRQQLMPDSDLDLMFISNPEPDEGASPYMRLAQRLLNGISVPTSEGELYKVDLRLRPHGDSGMICTQFASLIQYYDTEAWLWEHYALSQARVLYADGDFEAELRAWLHGVQTRPHAADDLRKAVQGMRPKICAAFPPQGLWDVKHQLGGLMDWGFCTQFLQMRLAAENPAVIGADAQSLLETSAKAGLIVHGDIAPSVRAARLLEALQMGMRISGGSESMRLKEAPPGQRRLLCRLSGCADLPTLEVRLQEGYQQIKLLYDSLFA